MMSQPEPALRIYSESEFRRMLAWEIQRATRYQDFLSLCLIRTDHSALSTPGLLLTLAQRVVELLRSTDLVGVVDDTIAVLLVHTPDSDAALTIERLRARVQTLGSEMGGADAMPTLTLGLASFPADATSAVALLSRARARLGGGGEAKGDRATR